MSVTIRLSRFGKRKSAYYRIIAVDGTKKRDGKYLEQLGTYNPHAEKEKVTIKEERIAYWLKNGAQLSDGLQKMWKTGVPNSKESKASKKETKKTELKK